jgi:hypothetical protein
MSEQVEIVALAEKASSLRFSERIGRVLGGLSVAAAGVDAVACIAAHNMSSGAAGIEAASLWLAAYSISLGASEGRKADTIDAELLQRQRPVESANQHLVR